MSMPDWLRSGVYGALAENDLTASVDGGLIVLLIILLRIYHSIIQYNLSVSSSQGIV